MKKPQLKTNIYKIRFSHTAPRDTEIGNKCFLLAHNDAEVFEFIKCHFITSWGDDERDCPAEYNVIRKKIIRLKGEMNDKDYDFADAFYGITLFGWELIAEDVHQEDFSKSIELGIIELINQEEGNGR